jgi:CDGSH-type Zn-finger protein
MADDKTSNTVKGMRIVVIRNGPYVVEGKVPLVSKKQVVSEYGEPLTWQKDGILLSGEDEYHLCRCGRSSSQPLCDGSHRATNFDGTESADTKASASRAIVILGGKGIIVRKDPTLCMQSGFCGMQDADIDELVADCDDTRTRSLVMAMVERCPSGALTYQIETDWPDIEPDLPRQVAVTTEITSDGSIGGPLWVTGGIPVERSDGQLLETRNRVTLCNCGKSGNKPLCDGTHRHLAQLEARRRRNSG